MPTVIKRVTTPTKLAPDGTPVIAPNYTVPAKTNSRKLAARCGLGQFPNSSLGLYYSDPSYQFGDNFLRLPGAMCALDYPILNNMGVEVDRVREGPFWYIPDQNSIHYSSTNGINIIPNKPKSLGLYKFIKNVVTNVLNFDGTGALTNTALNYDGGVYNKVLYNDVNSLQDRYNRGEFGPKNSPEALFVLDSVKGYLGRELLVKPVVQQVTFSNFAQNAIDNYTSQTPAVQKFLTKALQQSESVVAAHASVLAEVLYQGKQFFIDDIPASVTGNKNLALLAVHEMRNLYGQVSGAVSENPPAYLVGKTFTGMTTDGSTVTFEFNSTGYTRTVTTQ
jgi:hypothetical protein